MSDADLKAEKGRNSPLQPDETWRAAGEGQAMRILYAMIAITIIVDHSSPASAAKLCGREFTDGPGLISDITASGGKMILNDKNYLAFEESERMIVWTFVKEGTPTPAIVCRQPYQDGNTIRLKIDAICKGPKPACEALIASFSSPSGTKSGK